MHSYLFLRDDFFYNFFYGKLFLWNYPFPGISFKKSVMEANQILQSSMLDILFDGKNKIYGAYDLRKTYNSRIKTALAAVLLLIGILSVISLLAERFRDHGTHLAMNIPPTIVLKIPRDKIKPVSIPKPIIPTHVASVRVAIPVIVKSNEVMDPPPDVKQIENARIDLKTLAGDAYMEGIVNPPEEVRGTGVGAAPADHKTREDSVFVAVEIDAKFPGGPEAWQRYIQKAISSQLDEFAEGDYGTCTVKFIVDVTGRVSNVTALTMRGTRLAEISVNTIRKGPNWTPALQNGRFVNAWRVQPVTLLNPNQ
jgi:protein TonB